MSTSRTQSRAAGAEPVAGPPGEDSQAATGDLAVHLVTFGCQMNKYDSLLVEGRFRKAGHRITASMEDADVILFNTCSVREHAEERVYSWLGELRREKERRPKLLIGVLGCLAQRAQEEVFKRAGHVDLVVGTRRFHRLPELVSDLRERRADPERGRPRDQRVLDVEMDDAVAVPRAGETYTGGLQGYLAVMRGCDLNCTYCIVPKTRGRVMSRPVQALVDEATWMVGQGAKVITLLGQTVNSYGEDLPEPAPGEPRGTGRRGRPSLADLMRALQEVDGLERIRLITLHPSYVTVALAEAIRDCDKVDRFLPLPAQAGSDDVLRAMKRGYTTDLYRGRVALLREIVPDIELCSDWIVGFPGESESDFQASLDFLDEIGFAQNYVFKYDPRPETAAHERADDVSTQEKKDRNRRLLAQAERTQFNRLQAWVGRELDVFVEEVSDRYPGFLKGRSHHGLPVAFEGDAELVGRSVRVRAAESTPFGLTGELVEVAAS
ncbi:tRNA (N6-isopentenyl adenosine(37)-C2)-methylthiotransferase MiaB [Engelhardtia mirabilis]|uniref:tRNA-2-methylthio-N(6)-dimethylallyladenosine synthase n=1 Tax=Engelhardtia mirabilis TaxID=2528011 RepID=A0A518BLX7_9BACT|nr:tRNA-2-methylthio-N(6)-dimethylallyladenosine synthase [Planctomycetes bacterium Pla133]QDV02306.1 tRNA-2-methylthio-N(6)-dimethylallyladenosine synthase [Planctomycetes bacterium Pla86]